MNQTHLKKKKRLFYASIRKKVLPLAEEQIVQVINKLILTKAINNELKGYIGIYWPLAGEIDLRHIKTSFNLPVALPACKKTGQLTYHSWRDTPLRKDPYGIPAPLEEPPVSAQEMSMLLVPALAIDLHGNRLGYGGGFFDRLRVNESWRNVPTIVLVPKACVSEEVLPLDSWDIPFDHWINEEGHCYPV